MVDEVFAEVEGSIEKAHAALRRELGKLRTGRAHPGMLDSIRVDYYGQSTPIGQMATVNVPEPRLLTVKPWDKSQAKAIEKALRESDLGLNPQSDSEFIRIPIPPLSEQRRKDLVKLARRQAEDSKVAVRRARHEGLDLLAELKDGGDLGEDELDRAKKHLEDQIAQAIRVVDELIAAKEKEILTV